MLSTRTASGKRPRRDESRVGLALAGGGPLGGIYEIGALLALDDALQGVDFNDLDVYVGVSSGSLMAACLANGLSPAELYRIYIENASAEHPITPNIFQMPAFGEYYQRAAAIPELLLGALWRYVQNPLERGLWGSLQSLGRAIPTGVFDSAPIGRVLTKLFTTGGRTNDFRKLKHPLYVVATDLDTGESVEFGAKGFDHVPIAQAVQASTALPGLYPPTRIDGRDFVDGALKKTLHASVALQEGANLVFCINPLVPFDASLAKSARQAETREAHRRRPTGSAVANLPRSDSFAHAGGHGQVRHGLQERRRPAVRTQPRRCGDVLRERLQLCEPTARLRPCLSAHP